VQERGAVPERALRFVRASDFAAATPAWRLIATPAVTDLYGGAMYVRQLLRTRLRVPRYRGRSSPLHGGRNLFG
jgi:hypothetical protein